MDRGAAVGNEATVNDVKSNSLIATTQAATADRIYVLDPVAWYITTGGFQAARQMIVDVNQFLSDINQAVTVPSFE
jgi:iron complex transport system substrate-binding protein